MLFREDRLIVSIYDYTGNWVSPYIKAGYPTMLWDLKCEGDILKHFDRLLRKIDEAIEAGYKPYGLFSATPCDDFAVSGAKHWVKKEKPQEGFEPFVNRVELMQGLALVHFMLLEHYNFNFWVLENPVGRIETMVPELKPYRKMSFNPCDYGDPYTKKTILWGNFNTCLEKNPVTPEYIIWGGKKFPKLFAGTGGKSEKSKAKRSATPMGFANAFFKANQ